MAIEYTKSANTDDDLSFKTEFAVELHCEACVKAVKNILKQQDGIQNYEISLADQRVTVNGKASPAQIAREIKKTGKQCIVKGVGVEDPSSEHGNGTSAAVCIFESFSPPSGPPQGESGGYSKRQDVHGIARLVQAGNNRTILDLTIKHDDLAKSAITQGTSAFDVTVPTSSSSSSSSSSPSSPPAPASPPSSTTRSSTLQTQYGVYIANTGNLSEGAASTGGVWKELGQVELRKKDGYGDLFKDIQGLEPWQCIGRAMVIAPVLSSPSLAEKAEAMKLGPGILAGVIARSAGAWSNDKTVCSCSGKTAWQEAKEQPI